ncbi:MAG: alpha/beta fold hydrolase [Sulfuritalea sp.]|nr:alpha/beta fold hydrolase [Sulfuritalea sp.]
MKWILFGELLIYAVLGGWLLARHGWTPAQAVGLALACWLGVRLVIVALTFGIALSDSSLAAQRKPIGILGAGRMMFEELLALSLLFSVIQPFERFWLGPDRLMRPTDARLPLLLIHGYQCNRGFWFWLRPRLEAAGWIVATHSLEPVYADIDSYVEGIARRIDEVLAATGAAQVILVGHSMGGLASRACLRRYGVGKVARLVTLGSPHHGSALARFALGRNARQMEPGSRWLRALKEEGPPLPSAAICSCHENFVRPQASCALDGAHNIFISEVGHLAMALSPIALDQLKACLNEPAS